MVHLDGGTKAGMKLVSIKARKLLLTFAQYGNRGKFSGRIKYELKYQVELNLLDNVKLRVIREYEYNQLLNYALNG